MRWMIVPLVLSLAVSACHAVPAARSRSYLESHPSQLVEVLDQCRSHPGERGPACVNAYGAEEALTPGTLRPFRAHSDRARLAGDPIPDRQSAPTRY